MSDSSRALFSARLAQARELRGLSQRALGDRMGLGKKTGSTRINRYEQQASSIGLGGLAALAKTLEVPAAYLLAETPKMADAILVFAENPAVADALSALVQVGPSAQIDIIEILKKASTDPVLLEQLHALAESKSES